MHSFKTERLLIRPLAIEDKALFISLYTDAKVMRHISAPLTPEKVEKAFFRTLAIMKDVNPRTFTWAIVKQADNTSIGIQALTNLPCLSKKSYANKTDEQCNTTEIGIMLLRSANGKQFPEEAMGGLIDYAFKDLRLNKINARFSKTNLATLRFTKKLGFILAHSQVNTNHVTSSLTKFN